MLEELYEKYDRLQKKYGDKSLHSIYFGGKKENPSICFVFMNPTAGNIAAEKDWDGPRYPWLGTKNIWKLFNKLELLDDNILEEIESKKKLDWTKEFSEKVYKNIENHDIYITNLAKCTQIDARPLKDDYYKAYLKLFMKEMSIVKPKRIVLFGNQVSSIILNKKISVGECRKEYFEKEIGSKTYKVFPVYYPVGNGRFNIDKAIEDLKYIIENYVKDTVKTK